MTGAYFIDINTIIWPNGLLTNRHGEPIDTERFDIKDYPDGTRAILDKISGKEIAIWIGDRAC